MVSSGYGHWNKFRDNRCPCLRVRIYHLLLHPTKLLVVQNLKPTSYSSAFSYRLKKNECVAGPACGAMYPGFMLGANPKNIGKTVKKKVCFDEGNNCCAKKVFVKVKRCPQDFLIYQLPAAPSGSYRYCGSKSKKTTISLITPSPFKVSSLFSRKMDQTSPVEDRHKLITKSTENDNFPGKNSMI